jgi:hypothetical protein
LRASHYNAERLVPRGFSLCLLLQDTKAAYDVTIGGTSTGDYDQVNISGTATLGGALNVTIIDGYTPKPGDSVTVMTFTSATGQFATVTTGWSPTYHATSVVLTYKGLAQR